MSEAIRLSGLTQQGEKDEFFYLSAINRASLVGNVESGLLAPEKARRFAKAIDAVIRRGEADPAERPSRVIRYEPKLIELAGPEITELHVGRSSQDMHATYRIATLRDDVLKAHAALSGVLALFSELSARYRDMIVPSYTNGVAAQPTSLAHYLLGYSEALARCRDRLQEFYARVNLCPMGSTVLNGTGWPLQRRPMASRLGFDGIYVNAFDATQGAPVDMPVEYGQIMASAALFVGSFIQDLMVQYAQPRPWMILQEGGENTYVSSAMPQKRNPGLMNDTRAVASAVVAASVELEMLTHNLVPGMQDPKNVSNRARLTRMSLDMLSRLERILRALRLNPERALEELNSDWTASQEVADILMRKYGVPFRVGHHVASGMVGWARAAGVLPLAFPYAKMQEIFRDVTAKEWRTMELPMSEEEFKQALDPRAIVERRATEGGPQPASIDAMLAAREAANAAAAAWREACSARIDGALARLEAEFAAYLEG
ncbi:MAG: argininosuccinate lyase [Oscillospiraceae bacterium]|nr:argininosuccinate lyase [Oscillospiraceae bacterium]